jgi:hypothetical protein
MGLKEVLNRIEAIAAKYHTGKPYIVGGIPRDVYMKNSPLKTSDIDLTTNSSEVLRLGVMVAEELNVTFEMSDDGHLTVYADDFDLDFSSNFISDAVVEHLGGKYEGLKEAFSRDFTINTLHQDLVSREIIDPTGMGFEDINNKIIRTPVPAEITLTDDPRRAYRAINLAARYGFKIDDEIRTFVLDNPDIFRSEKVKDKYIAVKISKALKEDEEYTLELLKELGLFKNVPLTGHFKDVLIERKMIAEYLTDTGSQKVASELPTGWVGYSSQGPAHKALGEWWTKNHRKIPGGWNQSYDSWTKWYMNHYRGDWDFIHKSPEDTLQIMKQEAGVAPKPISPLAPTLAPKLKLPGKKMRGRDLEDQSRLTNNGKRYFLDSEGKVSIKPGANVDNVTTAVKEFIKELGNVAKELGAEIPVITSGWRSLESQVRIMSNNWKSNGGLKGGREYLVKIYSPRDPDGYGGQMASIFEQYGTGKKALSLGADLIRSRPVGSYHIVNPGKAVDIRETRGIKDVLFAIKDRGNFNIKIIDETDTARPHWHVTIKGQNGRVAGIRLRKDTIKRLGL